MGTYRKLGGPEKFSENGILVFETTEKINLSSVYTSILCNLSNLSNEDNGAANPLNFTNWKKVDLFQESYPEMNELRNLLATCCEEYIRVYETQYRGKRPNYASCWLNALQNYSSSDKPHYHHKNPFNLVAVYYAEGDFRENQGGTRFWLRGQNGIQESVFFPKKGSLIMFPATLLHAISPYKSETLRITFGMDIRFRKADFSSHPCSLLSTQASAK